MRYDKKAKELRAEILKMLYVYQSGRPSGSLSCVGMLMALYYEVTKADPKNPKDPDRDRFVLGEDHTRPVLYAVLANLGYFPKGDLAGLCQTDSHLREHPDCTKTLGVDVNIGLLGRDASPAMGPALAAKHTGVDYEVYAVLDDGEYQKGLVWEAAMAVAHHKPDDLTLMLNYDKLQIDGRNDEVMSLGNIVKKFGAFGFECFEVDGHDTSAVVAALKAPVSGRPRFACCNTIKGKGASFIEDQLGWHDSLMDKKQFEKVLSGQEVE